jgi:hypothetical protein
MGFLGALVEVGKAGWDLFSGHQGDKKAETKKEKEQKNAASHVADGSATDKDYKDAIPMQSGFAPGTETATTLAGGIAGGAAGTAGGPLGMLAGALSGAATGKALPGKVEGAVDAIGPKVNEMGGKAADVIEQKTTTGVADLPGAAGIPDAHKLTPQETEAARKNAPGGVGPGMTPDEAKAMSDVQRSVKAGEQSKKDDAARARAKQLEAQCAV